MLNISREKGNGVDAPKILNVLVLGDRFLDGGDVLRGAGYRLYVTAENSPSFPLHVATERSLRLAWLAEDYDIITIRNNRGTGLVQARRVPRSARQRAVIVWNGPPPDRMVQRYEELGYSHFAERGVHSGRVMLEMILSAELEEAEC